MIMHLLSFCRNKCQLSDFIQIFQSIFKKSDEIFSWQPILVLFLLQI